MILKATNGAVDIDDMIEIVRGVSPLKMIPRAVSGVYLLLSKNEVVYVGSSADVRFRIYDHRYSQGRRLTKKVFNEVAIIRVAGQNTALGIERELIVRFKPKYNVLNRHYLPTDRAEDTLDKGWVSLYSDPTNRALPLRPSARIVHAPRLGVTPPSYLPYITGSLCDKSGWHDDATLHADMSLPVTCANCLRVLDREGVAA